MDEMATLVSRIADRLFEAETECRTIAPIVEEVGRGELDLAYEIQTYNTKRALESGRRLVGRKIGLTSPAVQAQLGVDQPDFGMLFADMSIADGGEAPSDRMIQPKAEAEIAFVFGRDVSDAECTPADIIGAIDYCIPAIEIVDSRIADWKISIVDTIADNASSAMFVLGSTPRKLDEVDLRLCGMVLEKNGVASSFGTGAMCLGNPLNATLWLARKVASLGQPIKAGDTVLSGALGPMVPVGPGDRIAAEIGGCGSIRVTFSG